MVIAYAIGLLIGWAVRFAAGRYMEFAYANGLIIWAVPA
jgi:hypothetical protein